MEYIFFASVVCNIILVVFIIRFMQKQQHTLEQMKIDHEEDKKITKERALRSSRNTIRGQISEKFCPFQPSFPFAPEDCIFLGKPIDFMVLKNIEKYRDGVENYGLDDIEVIFLEIKTGNSKLSPVEEAIKYAIDHKRVHFETYRYDKNDELIATTDSSTCTQPNISLSPLDFISHDQTHRTETTNPHTLKSREQFTRSSFKWSELEEDLLIQKYDDGYTLDELGILFQRTPSGLKTRLEKLGIDLQLDE